MKILIELTSDKRVSTDSSVPYSRSINDLAKKRDIGCVITEMSKNITPDGRKKRFIKRVELALDMINVPEDEYEYSYKDELFEIDIMNGNVRDKKVIVAHDKKNNSAEIYCYPESNSAVVVRITDDANMDAGAIAAAIQKA